MKRALFYHYWHGVGETMPLKKTLFNHHPHRGFWTGVQKSLKERGVKLEPVPFTAQAPDPGTDLIVFPYGPVPAMQRNWLADFPKEKSLLFLYEPEHADPYANDPKCHEHFSTILTYRDDLVDNKTYHKYHLPHPLEAVEALPYDQKKFCCMVAHYKVSSDPTTTYRARRELIDTSNGEIALYGRRWEGHGYSNYRGFAPSKIKTMSHYRFSICYENCLGVPGYVSEKIFDCLMAYSVPIYWGAPNIEDYVPPSCFIDRRDFDSNEELLAFLRKMSQHTYDQYQCAIHRFLEGEAIGRFKVERVQNQITEYISHATCLS